VNCNDSNINSINIVIYCSIGVAAVHSNLQLRKPRLVTKDLAYEGKEAIQMRHMCSKISSIGICYRGIFATSSPLRSYRMRARSRGIVRAAGRFTAAAASSADSVAATDVASSTLELLKLAVRLSATVDDGEPDNAVHGPAMSETRARKDACRIAGSRPDRHRAAW
jgi:hypothetical protein